MIAVHKCKRDKTIHNSLCKYNCFSIPDRYIFNPAKVDFFVIYCFLHKIILHKVKNIL